MGDPQTQIKSTIRGNYGDYTQMKIVGVESRSSDTIHCSDHDVNLSNVYS